MKKSRIFPVLLVLVFPFLTACISGEEAELLKSREEEALHYYEEKYCLSDIGITDSRYLSYDGLFGPDATENMYFDMDDGYTVVYLGEEERFGDNRQKEEIREAITDYILKPALEQLRQDIGADEVSANDVFYNQYSTDNFTDEIFSTYYTDSMDMDVFMSEEQPFMNRCDIIIICGEEAPYRLPMEDFCLWLQESFILRNKIAVSAISDEWESTGLYDSTEFPQFYDDGCFLRCEVDNEQIYRYEANYIPLLPGIYVTSAEPNLILEEGDISLGESYREEELQQLIDRNYDALPDEAPENKNGSYMKHDKAHTKKGIVWTDTPVYRLNFSEKVRNALDENGNLHCHFRFVSDEVPNQGSSFYYFPNNDRYWYCFPICSSENTSDSGWINEEYYYFLGMEYSE